MSYTYANAVFDVPLPLTNEDILDILTAIEDTLCKLGVNPDIAKGCVRISVGPHRSTDATSLEQA